MLVSKLVSASSIQKLNLMAKRVFQASSRINGITKLTQRHIHHNTSTSYEIPEIEVKKLLDSFPTIIDGISSYHVFDEVSLYDKNKLKEMVEYNVWPTRYLNTAYSVVRIHNHLKEDEQMPLEKRNLLYITAICYHMVQSSIELLDDIVDNGLIRYNKPCWQTTNAGNGLNALNDAVLLAGLPMLIFKRFLSEHKHYHQMVELYNLLHIYSIFGQRLDCTKYSLDQMNMSKWLTLVKFKAAFHLALLPFKTTLLVTENYDDDKFRVMEPILIDSGVLGQMWNDFTDAFPPNTEKTSTDIQEHRCTWVLAKALELCSSEQRRVLEENYGKNEESCIEKVQQVYKDLGLKELGEKFKSQTICDIEERIAELPDNYPKLALKSCLNMV